MVISLDIECCLAVRKLLEVSICEYYCGNVLINTKIAYEENIASLRRNT